LISKIIMIVAMIALTIWGMETAMPGEGSSLIMGRAKMMYPKRKRPTTPAATFTTGRSRTREALNV
jgi:quinol-cytochrome oxidoreductase complex cytochrome b subunit